MSQLKSIMYEIRVLKSHIGRPTPTEESQQLYPMLPERGQDKALNPELKLKPKATRVNPPLSH